MKTIPIPTIEYLQECFHYNTTSGVLYWKERPRKHFKTERAFNSWNGRYSFTRALNYVNKDGYLCGTLDGASFLAHRVIYKIVHGIDPNIVLHENGKTTDNKILSSGSLSDNSKDQKIRVDNKSGIAGVSLRESGKWMVRINIEGKLKYLGTYESFLEACCKRKSAEVQYGYHINHGRRN